MGLEGQVPSPCKSVRFGPQSHVETYPGKAGGQPQQSLCSEMDGVLGLVTDD